MKENVNLYIRLERPNNEYADGELVFESSLNKSVNFGIFVANPAFAEFKDNVYLEVIAEMSEVKPMRVDRLALCVKSNDADTTTRFNDKVGEMTGCRVEDFAGLDPTIAWNRLNMLMPMDLPYGKIWTDKKYYPTMPKERDNFAVEYNEDKRSWTFGEKGYMSEPIFEVRIDEWGRPIFRFQPDSSGYPPTMECLLSDFKQFLSMHGNFKRLFEFKNY